MFTKQFHRFDLVELNYIPVNIIQLKVQFGVWISKNKRKQFLYLSKGKAKEKLLITKCMFIVWKNDCDWNSGWENYPYSVFLQHSVFSFYIHFKLVKREKPHRSTLLLIHSGLADWHHNDWLLNNIIGTTMFPRTSNLERNLFPFFSKD